jgi:hypothetical protein
MLKVTNVTTRLTCDESFEALLVSSLLSSVRLEFVAIFGLSSFSHRSFVRPQPTQPQQVSQCAVHHGSEKSSCACMYGWLCGGARRSRADTARDVDSAGVPRFRLSSALYHSLTQVSATRPRNRTSHDSHHTIPTLVQHASMPLPLSSLHSAARRQFSPATTISRFHHAVSPLFMQRCRRRAYRRDQHASPYIHLQ